MTTTSYAITLKDTVDEVIKTHPVVQERLRNYRATRQDMSIADAGYMPTIDIVAGVGWREQGRVNSDVKPEDNYDVYNSAITIKQNIFNYLIN